MDLQQLDYLKRSILKVYTSRTTKTGHTTSFWDDLEETLKHDWDKPAHNLTELANKNSKKMRGDLFEHFCYLYFKMNLKYKEVWMLKDVPDDFREKTGLAKIDVGIDLVAIDQSDRLYAIQAKFRTRNYYKSKTGVSWKQLSTFYGLVNKTGPWYKHVVITNADYVRHIGKKTKKDWSICRGSLNRIKLESFLDMADLKGNTLNENNNTNTNKNKNNKQNNNNKNNKQINNPIDTNELRRKRLNFFNSTKN